MTNGPSAPIRPRKMYLDIDGVLVIWDPRFNCIDLANGFGRLMRFCKLHHIQPYWLTTWSKFAGSLDGINALLWPKSAPTMAHPLVAEYGTAGKVSAIDFDSDWVWIEDGIGADQLTVLTERGQADRYYHTDGLDRDCLLKFMAFTQQKLCLPDLEDWGPPWDSYFSRPRAHP